LLSALHSWYGLIEKDNARRTQKWTADGGILDPLKKYRHETIQMGFMVFCGESGYYDMESGELVDEPPDPTSEVPEGIEPVQISRELLKKLLKDSEDLKSQSNT